MNLHDIGKMSCNSFVGLILSLSPAELAILGCAIGLSLLPFTGDPYEQSSIGNFFELIGQVLLTSGAQGQNIEDHLEDQSVLNERIKDLQRQINELKKTGHF